MTFEELEPYFSKRNCGSYERENYDKYLKHSKFVFNIPSIHITGTNGKGGTANYLYHIYLAAGYKVGLFNSPYLNSVDEMVSINGKTIGKPEYIAIFNEYKEEFESAGLTAFEMQTILAFELFKRANLDLVIVEVGMGGFIDATNIITPILSIITSVSLEHTVYLGYSTSEIAYNKAGIIKNRVPALIGSVDEDALYAIRDRARKTKSEIRVAPETFNEKLVDGHIVFDCKMLSNVHLNTPSLYQVKNANLALEAVNLIKNQFPVSEEDIREGLKCENLDCRFEWFNKQILLDGGHNPEAIKELVNTVKMSIHQGIHVIFACFRDKHFSQMLNILDEISDDITITTFNHPRAKTKDEYLLFLETYKFVDDYIGEIKSLCEQYPDDVILVTGGLYFAGLVKRELSK